MTTTLDDQTAARRALLLAGAHNALTAATAGLARLTAYALHLQRQTWDATTDDATLKAARDPARDPAQCAEALGVGL